MAASRRRGVGEPSPDDRCWARLCKGGAVLEERDMKNLFLGFLLLLCLALPSSLYGMPITMFDNATYTDPAQESAHLAASLVALGHTVSVFSGITAADWTAATSGVPLLVIPELDTSSLYPALSAAAITVIQNYVAGGGGLLMFDQTTFSDHRTTTLLNGVFGFSLVPSALGLSASTFLLDPVAAAGTAFAGGPATLAGANATEGVQTSSLPVGALAIYTTNAGADTGVFVVGYGAGRIGFLGHDWFLSSTPANWQTVLGAAVTQTAVPEPSTVLLLGAGLAGLALLRRKFAR